MKISNRDARCIDWYRRLIKDDLAEAGQRIAVEMHDQLYELEEAIEREKAARENPEPLTLEQLREMDGEPVWVIDIERERRGNLWCVLDGGIAHIPGVDHSWYPVSDYGETWIAYAHKPGGGAGEMNKPITVKLGDGKIIVGSGLRDGIPVIFFAHAEKQYPIGAHIQPSDEPNYMERIFAVIEIPSIANACAMLAVLGRVCSNLDAIEASSAARRNSEAQKNKECEEE